jgi:hypothetical protein
VPVGADGVGAEAPPSEEDEERAPEPEDEERESVSELLEELARHTSALGWQELQLTASHHVPELRRALRDLGATLVVALAFLTAFALLNWAAVQALAPSLPGWRSPLVLAGAWMVVGAALAVALLVRAGRISGWEWWRLDSEQATTNRDQARAETLANARDTLERLGAAVAREAEARIASAIVPLAGGVVEAGEDLLEASEEVLEVIEEEVPGGGMISQVIDLVLIPGRFGVRIATTVLKGNSAGGSE